MLPLCNISKNSWHSALIVQAEIMRRPTTVFVDTGASVSLMFLECFQRIRGKRTFVLDPSDIRLCGVSYFPISAVGKHLFDFYIADGINLPAETLLCNPDLTKNNVDILSGGQMPRYRYRYVGPRHIF